MSKFILPPPSDEGFEGTSAADLVGELCAIRATKTGTKATRHGESDVVIADVVVIAPDAQLTDRGEVTFFWSVFVKDLSRCLDQWVVCRPTQPEGKTYYVLGLPSDDEMVTVVKAMGALSDGPEDEPF